MGNNQSNGFSGLLALWGPLILIGALIFVFQVDRNTQEETKAPQTASPAKVPDAPPQTVIATPSDEPRKVIEGAPALAAPAAPAEVTEALDAAPPPDRQPVAEETQALPEQASAATVTPLPSADAPPGAATAVADAPTAAYILAYPPVSGPYRLSSARWQAPPPSPLERHRRQWPPDAGAAPHAEQWVPCAPPHYWCRPAPYAHR